VTAPAPLDTRGLDTRLALRLLQAGRFDLATLQGLVAEVRASRPEGVTLARLLVLRGLLPATEASEHVADTAAQDLAGATQTIDLESRTEFHPPPPPAPSPPRPLAAGGWRVLERLGAGGMGAAFLVEGEGGVRRVLKVLDGGADAELQERFRREAEAQARVDDHPHVARVYGHHDHDGRPGILMEHVPGETLEARFRQGAVPAREAARLVRALASGAAHLHGHGLVHRDVKPANVVLDAVGAPKLIDFGLVKVHGARSLTETGVAMGTPAYMAPEQAMGLRHEVGPWSDVYALGAVLYHALTGHPPFTGKTAIETLSQLLTDDPVPLRDVVDAIPDELAGVCERALAKDLEERPTAAEMVALLDRFLEPALAAVPLRKGRGPATGGLLPAVAVAAAAFGAGWLLRDQQAPEGADAVAATRAATPAEPDRPDPRPSPTTPPSTPADPPPDPPAPDPSPAVADEAPSPALGLSWTEGEAARWRLAITNEAPWIDEFRVVMDLAWRVEAVDDEAAALAARIEALSVRWVLAAEALGAMRARSPDRAFDAADLRFAYDSAVSEGARPFDSAIGRELELRLDRRTGAVLHLSGLEGLTDAIAARGRAGAEWKYRRIPFLEPPRFQRLLDRVLRLFPHGDHEPDEPWSLSRRFPPDVTVAGPPPEIELEAVYEPGAIGITWRGVREGEVGAFTIEGQARLRNGRLVGAADTERTVGVDARGRPSTETSAVELRRVAD